MKQENISTNPPPFLLGASLLFWGWQAGLFMIAVFMAAVLEAARHIRFRWDFSNSEMNRISDLCALIFIAVGLYLFMADRSVYIIFTLLAWLPMVFFPLMFAQNFSIREKIDIRTISLFLRKQKNSGLTEKPITINLNYPFFALVILCSSFANLRDFRFYLGLIILTAWALLSIRPKNSSPFLWICLYLLVCIGGYAGQTGLSRLQQILERKGLEWFYNLEREDADPYRSMTAIGYIGELKLSDRIGFRVRAGENIKLPLLLREASYNKYSFSKWYSGISDFSILEPELDGITWNLGPYENNHQKIEVSAYLKQGSGMLKIPTGTFRLMNLPVLGAEVNPFGAVRVQDGPSLINYTLLFSPQSADSPPGENDFLIPKQENDAVLQTAGELGIISMKNQPEKVLNILDQFFSDHFSYSLELLPQQFPSPLADFLKRSRSGHCEYFATATVLLLRSAGIAARYATGFSAHEYSTVEKQIVVRDRHAHAWALAWIDGKWRDVDNTPGNWRSDEAENASSWQFLSDLKSWLTYRFSLWQWQTERKNYSNHLLWLLIPLLLVPLRRLWRKKRISPLTEVDIAEKKMVYSSGKDSFFYRIEERLTEMGYFRGCGDPLLLWISGLEKISSPEQCAAIPFSFLKQIAEVHYRYRFDPLGITEKEKENMDIMISNFLKKLDKTDFPRTLPEKNPEKIHPML